MAGDDEAEIRLDDFIDLDGGGGAGQQRRARRQQAAFHTREVRELGEAIAADAMAQRGSDRPRDPRQAERTRHRALELLCLEIAEAFDWLGLKQRPSSDLDLGLEQVRARYETATEIALLRRIAETEYPLLTSITLVRQNGVGLLTETRLSLKHAARGRALADALDAEGAETLLAGWLGEAAAIGAEGIVHMLPVAPGRRMADSISRENARSPAMPGCWRTISRRRSIWRAARSTRPASPMPDRKTRRPAIEGGAVEAPPRRRGGGRYQLMRCGQKSICGGPARNGARGARVPELFRQAK